MTIQDMVVRPSLTLVGHASVDGLIAPSANGTTSKSLRWSFEAPREQSGFARALADGFL